ncbi:MAG: hypothetical protein DRP65_05740 [Planctomycetota bacterium]|nr:MAG: hypothetical protein DRP65_05740 [Planctomycetota bacterium]
MLKMKKNRCLSQIKIALLTNPAGGLNVEYPETNMLNYRDRKNRIHIITLDGVLAADVYERLKTSPKIPRAELVLPTDITKSQISVEDIDNLALDTVKSRLLIIDVRSCTLPRLQRAYNKIVGYNRADFNLYCYTVVIGDGPANLFEQGGDIDDFAPHLAKFRIDYSPAVFFYDPLLHYSHGEKLAMGIDRDKSIPQTIPHRLKKGFESQGEQVTVEDVRRYFRAEGAPDDKKRAKKRRRLGRLAKLYRKKITKQFPEVADELVKCLKKSGYSFTGEALPLNTYPFYFEEWVAELLEKAKKAISA